MNYEQFLKQLKEDLQERFAADLPPEYSDAGFDGVEIHAAHKFLISQFLSPACCHAG